MSRRIRRLQLAELRADLAHYLEDTKVKRLGYLGEFFQTAGHNPDVLLSFMKFTDELGEALPRNVVETVSLTVAGYMDNPYERNQHERLCLKLGYSREWVAAVNKLDPESSAELAPPERAAQHYTLAALERKGIGVEAEFEELIDALSPAKAIAVVFLVGRYTTHAMFVNTLGLAPPVASIFEAAT